MKDILVIVDDRRVEAIIRKLLEEVENVDVAYTSVMEGLGYSSASIVITALTTKKTYKFLGQITSELPKATLIVMAPPDDQQEAMHHGCDHFISVNAPQALISTLNSL